MWARADLTLPRRRSQKSERSPLLATHDALILLSFCRVMMRLWITNGTGHSVPLFHYKEAPRMFTRILVAVSASSVDAVLESAIDIAKKHDARIFALHVVDPAPCWMGPMDYDFGLAVQTLEAHGRDIVTRTADVLDDHARPAETRMVTLPIAGQTVGQAIASAADASGADLILLGERKSGWWRWLGADVASEVRRHTNTPIQVVSGKVAGGSTCRVAPRWTEASAADAQ
jgi:nucleotide-binding universal stress UspA family protein